GVDHLITMLADDVAVEQVVFGADGAIKALPRGSVHISMSTISVAMSARLAEAHESAGQGYVAAPVFGRPEAAAAARMLVVASGPAGDLERCRPLLESVGALLVTFGDRATAANVVKIAGNFMIASAMETLGEAFALLRKSGVDTKQFLDVMTNTLFSAPIYQNYGKLILSESFDPPGFKLTLGLKDVKLALAAAEGVSAPLPLASLGRDHL